MRTNLRSISRSRASAIIVALLLTACGGKHTPATNDPGDDDTLDAPPPASRTAIETRRDAACEQLGPKITNCAIEDAKKTMSPEELAQLDPEKVRPVHTRKFIEACKGQTMSSRQVRVYEVCLAEETDCDALLACLDHAKPQAGE